MSVLEPIFFTYFKCLKTTSPSRKNILHYIPYSLQKRQTFRKPLGGIWRVYFLSLPLLTTNLNVVGKITCFPSLSEVSTGPVSKKVGLKLKTSAAISVCLSVCSFFIKVVRVDNSQSIKFFVFCFIE